MAGSIGVEHVVAILKAGKSAGRGCSLLIGAGCSITANIPSAAGFVDIIKQEFEPHYLSAKEKTYPACMSELPDGIQRDLIARYVDNAKINWAHIAIAQLLANGWVDRILTTNFDPLIVRACALVGIHPAVYDFAASQFLKPVQIPDRAVFHLHGQRTGFVLMNTAEDLAQHSELLGPLFEDAGSGRTWIVVGYSGENDPVFDHLANVDNFDYGLFWVGYKDAIPTSHVKSKLLDPKKNAEFISKHDADSFFVELAQKLGCFPPKFVADPFGHLEFLLKDLTEFEVAQGDAKFDVMESPRWQIDQAKSLYKSSASSDMSIPEIAAMPLFMAGHYEQVIALLRTVPKLSDQSRDSMSWSYTMLGIALSDQAGAKSGDEADKLWEAVGENYQQAIDIEPDRYEAPLNWGNALYSQALNKSGFEANELFEASSEKYQQALGIKPDFDLARRSWGGALLAQAKMKSDAEKAELIGKAIKALKPSDDFDTEITSYNLACAYALLGDSKTTKHYLLAAKKTENLPDREHLESDNDMDLVRNRKWFKDMIAEL